MAKSPAGSLEPMTANKGKWHDGIGGVEIGQLSALATDIDKTIDTTVKQVARGKIRVGKLLLEARALFDNDMAFGLWRKQNTQIQSKQHTHYLMQVAERFGDAVKLIDGANYSVMQELVLADQTDIKWVEDKIDAGEVPKVQEVRAKVKQTQAERLAPKGTSKKALKASGDMVSVPLARAISPNAPINIYVTMGLTRRIQAVRDYGINRLEGAFIILGMDPDPQTPCHSENLDGIHQYWVDCSENEEEMEAINDSFELVKAEFAGWNGE